MPPLFSALLSVDDTTPVNPNSSARPPKPSSFLRSLFRRLPKHARCRLHSSRQAINSEITCFGVHSLAVALQANSRITLGDLVQSSWRENTSLYTVQRLAHPCCPKRLLRQTCHPCAHNQIDSAPPVQPNVRKACMGQNAVQIRTPKSMGGSTRPSNAKRRVRRGPPPLVRDQRRRTPEKVGAASVLGDPTLGFSALPLTSVRGALAGGPSSSRCPRPIQR